MNRIYGEALSKAAEKVIEEMSSLKFKTLGQLQEISGVDRSDEGLVISLPFYGQVTGHYLMILNNQCAERLLSSSVTEQKDLEILHSFLSEILNNVVGEAAIALLEEHQEISIFTPIINSCPVRYPNVNGFKTTVRDANSEIDFYLLIEPKKSSRLITSGDDIQDAVKEVYDADEVRNQLLGIMSHELRTPLNSIMGFTDILLEECEKKEHGNMLSVIKDSGTRMYQIIESIYDYMQLKKGKTSLEHVSFDLENEIYTIVNDYSLEIERKALDLNVDISNAIPHMIGDVTKLRKILHSLISNAVKYTDEGKISITIKPNRIEGKWQELRFSIKDTGIGISDEQSKQILKPFEQGDMSSTRRFEGIGLGLTVGNGLINVLGGQLQLESELNKGTTSIFNLKFELAKVSETNNKQFENYKAAIIDNNTDFAIENYLEQYGMEFTKFHSLTDFLKKHTGTLDVLYINIGSMRNVHQAELICKNKIAQKVINIVDTKHVDFKDKLVSFGFNNFLKAPLEPKDIASVTKRVIGMPEIKENHKNEPRFNILVAEDNLVSQLVIKKVFTLLGHEIILANDGSEALEKIQKNQVDVVFMDINMPVIDGLEATKRIRMKREYDQTPIFALTARKEEGFKERCISVGMNGYIEKPFKLEKIKKLLDMYSNHLLKKQTQKTT